MVVEGASAAEGAQTPEAARSTEGAQTPLTTPFVPVERSLPLLVDDAGLLTESQEAQLLAALEEISARQECEVAIVTVDGLDGKTATEFADDYYDYNGYGYGGDDSGILLLLSMKERAWAITTYGFAITAFTDYGQEYMMDQVLPGLSSGKYAQAFGTFAQYADWLLTQARNGEVLDVPAQNGGGGGYGGGSGSGGGAGNRRSRTLADVPDVLLPAMIPGGIVAVVALFIMVFQMHGVRPQTQARQYVRGGSFVVTGRSDVFLYQTVTKTRKSESRSSGGGRSGGGGSSTHSSSSGRSHGGSSGRF
ncbi:MAG: TPM domain-containing protein [Lachnospiraceae bacterium]|jgi:uncharacterized protein|nr:TPM domain-containing protein [Lachnospiraceae bacterium]